jgi:3'-phosphoadenosine 5'-phosphosulfate sulfotransferase (PAPS reductase)/FAD synthetase
MFDHWIALGKLLGSPIVPVIGGTLTGLIERQKALPNWRQRWCTRILKIEPFARFLATQSECTSYVGLRADEPLREGGDYLEIPGITMDFPLRRWFWTLHDVLSYLSKRNVQIPVRTDCDICFFQRLSEWYNLWRYRPESWTEGERLEALTGHTFRSPGRDSWPAGMKELRLRFEAGDIPKKVNDPMATMKCRVCRI